LIHAVRRGAAPRWYAFLFALGLGAFRGEPTASADPAPPVAVGEVDAPQGDAAAAIKSTLSEELPKLKLPAGRKFIVSASLVKLETRQSGVDATTQAIVSLAVRDAKNGAIRGVINGSGLVKSRAGDPTVTKTVVETAVRGATRSLPVVLAQAQ
jgi:hypothetical protein